jgi:NAD-dependent DNA ligase
MSDDEAADLIPDSNAADVASASPAQAQRWRELVDVIDDARRRYYVHDAATLSDAEYDEFYRELEALEAAYPELVSRLGLRALSATSDQRRRCCVN